MLVCFACAIIFRIIVISFFFSNTHTNNSMQGARGEIFDWCRKVRALRGCYKYACAVMIRRAADGEVTSHFHFAGKLWAVFELYRHKQNSLKRRRLKKVTLSKVSGICPFKICLMYDLAKSLCKFVSKKRLYKVVSKILFYCSDSTLIYICCSCPLLCIV